VIAVVMFTSAMILRTRPLQARLVLIIAWSRGEGTFIGLMAMGMALYVKTKKILLRCYCGLAAVKRKKTGSQDDKSLTCI
jgi:hypothetical protein